MLFFIHNGDEIPHFSTYLTFSHLPSWLVELRGQLLLDGQ